MKATTLIDISRKTSNFLLAVLAFGIPSFASGNIGYMETPQKTKVLFIHHSTGGNIIKQGKLRDLLKVKNPDIEFWDHSYNLFPILPNIVAKFTNYTGLTDNAGRMTTTDYDIVLSNNSPKEYAEIFSRDSSDPTLSKILEYDVVIFKNCFPTSNIKDDGQLSQNKAYYKQIRDSLKNYPTKKFVLFTSPPLRREVTSFEIASRARVLADWLKSPEFLEDSSNLYVFDLFGLLIEQEGDNKNTLRRDFTSFIWLDSHPNKKANKLVAEILSDYLVKLI